MAVLATSPAPSSSFRDFDPRVMAAVIQRALDGLPFLLETHRDIDLGAYATELVTTFELATGRRN